MVRNGVQRIRWMFVLIEERKERVVSLDNIKELLEKFKDREVRE